MLTWLAVLPRTLQELLFILTNDNKEGYHTNSIHAPGKFESSAQ